MHHQSVANWTKAHSEKLPQAPVPAKVKIAELDELFTFTRRKNKIYVMTLVDRETRCILSWKMVWEQSPEAIQARVDEVPKAKWYFSDGWEIYASLWYHFGRYAVSEGKTDTFSVAADSAELRHYLARLVRCSRCFSRCPFALACAIRLFV